jgi:hypothetical protein
MEKNIEKALSNFVDLPQTEEEIKIKNSKKVVLHEREGLIERVDKILITKDGKQLLREVY